MDKEQQSQESQKVLTINKTGYDSTGQELIQTLHYLLSNPGTCYETCHDCHGLRDNSNQLRQMLLTRGGCALKKQ